MLKYLKRNKILQSKKRYSSYSEHTKKMLFCAKNVSQIKIK